MTHYWKTEPVDIAGPRDVCSGKVVDAVLIPQETITERVKELGRLISEDYRHRTPLVVGVLKGSFVFLADLIRSLDIPVTMDFLGVRSYASGESTGRVKVTHDLELEVTGRHILLVDDIVDTGLTLRHLTRLIEDMEPASLSVCALLVKRKTIEPLRELSYIGFRIPDVFVVGYGLDYNGDFRNLPYIGVLEKGGRA